MADVPDLMSLCMESITTEIIHGDRERVQDVLELPSDLFDCLVLRLPPLGLHKLQQQMSFAHFGESTIDGVKDGKKRGRYCAFNTAWKSFYKSRWPEGVRQSQPMDHLRKQSIPGLEPASFSGDWQQMYWEAHLQNCLDKAAEAALLPSFDGCIGEITIPGNIMELIGYKRCLCHSTCAYSNLSYHCEQFGCYARCLRLHNVLCVAETCRLLRDSKLRGLVLRGIKSEEHVNGTCKLLKQNSETLSSLEFIYCKLSSTAIDAICNSLYANGIQKHGIQYFSIKASSLLERDSVSLPSGLLSFLSSGSSLCLLSFCENRLGPSFAKIVFDSLLDASSGPSILDLSDNNIAGWLSSANWRLPNCLLSSLGTIKSLWSLRVLNLRGNNLRKDDANGLRYALLQMPNLEYLDLSENPIDDDGIRNLIPYLAEASERGFPLSDVKIENCDLSYDGVADLLRNLSTLKKPLNSLSIADNDLGRQVAEPLAKNLGASCVRVLNIEEIGLGPSGFSELREKIPKEIKLADINISKNRGGIEAAKFIVELILRGPELVAINAAYNFMPLESLGAICSALSLSKGRLEKLDLTGNTGCYQADDTSMLTEFKFRGKPIVILPSFPVAAVPYDDDP